MASWLRSSPRNMTILNSFLDIIAELITYDIFIYLGMFCVLCGAIVLVLKLARGDRQ